MTKFSALAIALVFLASPTKLLAAAAITDEELVKLCIAETLFRDGEDQSGGSTQLVSSNVTRSPEQQIVTVEVSIAEGRVLSGRCIVRNDKIFDFRN